MAGMDNFAQNQGLGAPVAGGDIIDITMQSFRADVIEESARRLVLVDFWAPWCGPCKQLTPTLEKIVRAAKGQLRLAKMNIDQYPEIAGRLGVQSIPAVFAFKDGRPVDGFMGALPEGEIKAFLAKLGGGVVDVEALVAEANVLLEAGDPDSAEALYLEAARADAENAAVFGGLARVQIARGDLAGARALLDSVPSKLTQAAPVAAARAALALEERAGEVGDMALLLARVETNPADMQARYDLAVALNGAGQREAAAQELLAIFKRDRAWNEDGARKLLLEFFESWGPLDPATKSARRQLSSLLFA